MNDESKTKAQLIEELNELRQRVGNVEEAEARRENPNGHYLKEELYHLVREDASIFDFIQNGSLDGIWYWDLEKPEHEWMSPRFWEIFGYDPDEKPHLAEAWQDMIHPDDLEVALDNFHKHCEDPEHLYDQMVRYRHKNGSTVWVRCRGLAIRDRKGKPVRMLGAHTEATALKETEVTLKKQTEELERSNAELKREIADRSQAEEEKSRLDEQLRYFSFLYQLRTVLAMASSFEEVIQRAGESIVQMLTVFTSAAGCRIEFDHRAWTFGQLNQVGQHTYERPLRWDKQKRGSLRLCCGVEFSKGQEQGLVEETAAQISQVLEARELQLQILRSARLVSLGQMAAGMAHELNQPLTALSATAEGILLRQQEDMEIAPERLQGMMEHMLRLVERMVDTIQHLRIFSRDTSKEPGALLMVNEVVQSALELIQTQLKSRGIDLELDLGEELPEVLGHPHPLEQVLLNLLSNARDALDKKEAQLEGGGKSGWGKLLSIRTRHDTEAGQIILEVEDQGTGIDAEDQQRLFEPFFTTKEPDKGTGLGLSLAYAIVKDHGGEIECQSQERKGTLFRVRLPVAESHGF